MSEYNLVTYLDTIRRSPRQAAKEIIACVIVLSVLTGAIFLKDILLWIEGVLR